MAALLAWAIGIARHTWFMQTVCPQLLEQGIHRVTLRTNGLGNRATFDGAHTVISLPPGPVPFALETMAEPASVHTHRNTSSAVDRNTSGAKAGGDVSRYEADRRLMTSHARSVTAHVQRRLYRSWCRQPGMMQQMQAGQRQNGRQDMHGGVLAEGKKPSIASGFCNGAE